MSDLEARFCMFSIWALDEQSKLKQDQNMKTTYPYWMKNWNDSKKFVQKESRRRAYDSNRDVCLRDHNQLRMYHKKRCKKFTKTASFSCWKIGLYKILWNNLQQVLGKDDTKTLSELFSVFA